jgi:hypothetical protein
MTKSKTKSILQSKTFIVAVIQAVIGVIAVFTASYPELQAIGGIAVVKSILDIVLRYITVAPVK